MVKLAIAVAALAATALALASSPAGAETKVYAATYPPLSPMPTVEQNITDATTDSTCGIECFGGGGFCNGIVTVNSNTGFSGNQGYDLRLQVYYCSNNFVIGTTCTRRRWVQATAGRWEFLGWIGWQTMGGPGTTRCGAWSQAHVKQTDPWDFDDHRYPCMRAIGYASNPSVRVSDQSCSA